jgi:hypothetical protein
MTTEKTASKKNNTTISYPRVYIDETQPSCQC